MTGICVSRYVMEDRRDGLILFFLLVGMTVGCFILGVKSFLNHDMMGTVVMLPLSLLNLVYVLKIKRKVFKN